ncbi:MAG: hypothetical protein ACLGH3_08135 [Actinomycetota bacterium]
MTRRRATAGAALSVALALQACSTPAIRLAPTFEAGSVRRYTLSTESRTVFTGPGGDRALTSTLAAETTLEVLGISPLGVLLGITVSPTSATRDGAPIEPPPEQTAEVRVGPDGSLIEIVSDDATDTLGSFAASDLAGVLGPVVPEEEVALGYRWEERNEGSIQRGRVVSLRRTQGIDCVVLSLSSSRTVERRRSLDGRPLTLDGVERTATTMDRSLEDGYPVRLETVANTSLTVRSGTLLGGSVVIEATTTMDRVPQVR